jgi:lysine-specific demethylase 8
VYILEVNSGINIHAQIPLKERVISGLVFVLQHVAVNSAFLKKIKNKNVEKICQHLEAQQKFEDLSVDRRESLSEAEFVRSYLNKGRPVIFNKQAADWTCCKKWNLDFFSDYFKEQSFSLIESTGLVEKEFDATKGHNRPVLLDKITGSEFVKTIKQGERKYMRFCPIMETNPELKEALDLNWLKKMRKCFLGISYQTFVGAATRKTPLHSETTAFFYIMADGEKKWNLYSPSAVGIINPEVEGRGYNFSRVNCDNPDLKNYPGFDKLQRYTCHLKKGDVLFVPSWMWHEVYNVTDGWGLSYRFTSLRGFLRYPSYVFIRLFCTSPSFFEVFYFSFFKSDISKRDKNLLTPKIFFRND